jgi:hypothetical protein
LSETARVFVAAGSGAILGRTSRLGGVLVSGPVAGPTRNCITLPGRVRVGDVEVVPRLATAEGLVGTEVLQDDLRPDPDVGEVHDDVGALRWPEQKPLEPERRRQEAALRSDLPERQAIAELEQEEARIAAVQEAEAVAGCSTSRNGQVVPFTTIVLPRTRD